MSFTISSQETEWTLFLQPRNLHGVTVASIYLSVPALLNLSTKGWLGWAEPQWPVTNLGNNHVQNSRTLWITVAHHPPHNIKTKWPNKRKNLLHTREIKITKHERDSRRWRRDCRPTCYCPTTLHHAAPSTFPTLCATRLDWDTDNSENI